MNLINIKDHKLVYKIAVWKSGHWLTAGDGPLLLSKIGQMILVFLGKTIPKNCPTTGCPKKKQNDLNHLLLEFESPSTFQKIKISL